MSAFLLALGAALGWGVADLLAGVASRSVPVGTVLVATQAVGFAVVGGAIAVSMPTAPDGRVLLFAAFAGASVALALGALYKGMQVGAISLVAPISATAVVVPVAFSLARGDSLTALEVCGFVLAFSGVLLAAVERSSGYGVSLAAGASLALLAAATGGLNNVFIDLASSGGVLWTLAIQRGVVAAVGYGALRARRRRLALSRGAVPVVLTIGVLDLGGTGSFALATTRGALSIVAMVAALYPVVTVICARFLLGDRLTGVKRIGAAAAIAGVVLLAASQA